MEPLNAVARFNEAGDKLEVWDGSQDLGRSRDLIAKGLGLKPDQVDVHQCYLGGGFGRRSLADYALEAAMIAREVKRPVKLVWTREEDLAYGMFRPLAFQCMEAAVDAEGKVIGWKHCGVGDDGNAGFIAGGMKVSSYYDLPNQQLELRNVSHGIRVKHWRAVAHNFNLFAIEGIVDEMAPIRASTRSTSVCRRCRSRRKRAASWKPSPRWRTPRQNARKAARSALR